MFDTRQSICKLDITFHGLLGSDFLEYYNCIIDLRRKSVVIDFKTTPEGNRPFNQIEHILKTEVSKVLQQ